MQTTTTDTTHGLETDRHCAMHAHDELRDHLRELYLRELLPPQVLDYQIDGSTLRELLGLEVTQ